MFKGGFTRQSNAGDGYLQYKKNPAPARSISLIEDGACRIFAVSSSFTGHRIPNYHYKE